MNRILVVDDEPSLRFVLAKGLTRKGHAVDEASCVAEAVELLNEFSYLCVFMDIVLPDGSGLELLDSVRKRPNAPAVVVMTAEATMKNAIEAMQKGAFDYITKPFDLNDVEALVARVAGYRATSVKLAAERTPEPESAHPDEIIGRAPAMQEVFKLIGRAADSGATILITGPTGAGKELVARALHQNSSRAKGPFVTVNCAAIPHDLLESEMFGHVKGAFTGATEDKKGKFFAANGGSILLDEVGDMPAPLQAKMLRVLQDKEFYPVGSTRPVRVDTRVIASTNRDLAADVAEGKFREDLYHRLNVVHIKLPSLKERKEDIPALARSFLGRLAKAAGSAPKIASPEAMAALAAYDWPGNVRELENVVRRAALMSPGEAITPESLPVEIAGAASRVRPESGLEEAVRGMMERAAEGEIYETVISAVERTLINGALARAGGVQAHAARILGINRNTIMKKIGELGIKPGE
ncbi:MAG: sigma-54-dependent Fis family transcriptional regulator [Nitrospinae bacterium]|nr:sigma-54-dependent Fis family transcriptional regulator [Nitrospinota bacterium]